MNTPTKGEVRENRRVKNRFKPTGSPKRLEIAKNSQRRRALEVLERQERRNSKIKKSKV